VLRVERAKISPLVKLLSKGEHGCILSPMRSSESSIIRFRKSIDLETHPFSTLLLYNVLYHPSRKASQQIRFMARVAGDLESMPESQEELSARLGTSSLEEETEEEKYRHNVFRYYLALVNHINRLEAIHIYLSFTDSLNQKLEKNQITVAEWLQYHFSNHVLTIVSIYDTALCLFNAVAQLNIDQSPLFEKNIRKKVNGIKEYNGIKRSLDNIKSKVSQHRKPRNSFAHGGQNPDHDHLQALDLLDKYNFWRQYLKLEDETIARKRKAEMNRLAIDELSMELAEETDEICQLVLNLFSALQPIYEQNLVDKEI
jgi:Cthe_2314-like HEPN